MWRSSLARVLVWFVALAGLGYSALAQQNSGTVFGRVVDEQAGAIPGATATLTGDIAPRTTVTDANGNFRFLKVPIGTYKVSISMPGFAPFERTNVIVALNTNTEFTAELRVNVQEKVTVTSTTPLIDTRKVETGATFSQEELTQIPTSRDVYALMQQVPGVQLDQVNVAGSASARIGGPDFSTKGSGGVTYMVDGATTTDNSYGTFNGGQARQNGGTPMFFDFETFDSVEVATGGSLLDLQTPGVTINVVTKRGTNEFKGSARFLYASHSWQADNTSQEAIDEGFQTDSTHLIREFGGDLGGPIIKDRLWIWGAGSRQDVNRNLSQVDFEGNQIKSNAEIKPWTAKINAQLAPSNAASFYYQYSDRFEDNRATFQPESRLPETRTSLEIPTHFFKLEDNHVFSPDLVGTVFFSYQNPRYFSLPQGSPDVQTVLYDDLYHGSWLYYVTKNPQYQGNATVSKFFNTGKVNHELKASFNYRRQVNDSASAWPGDQIFGSEFSTYAQAAVTRGVRAIFKNEYYTGTLGDTITADRLTVNVGVRYDVQHGKNLPSTAPANPTFPDLLPAVVYNGDTGTPFNYKNWQPRVSASYAFGKDRKTLARASYARYADQLGFLPYQLNGLPIVSGIYYYWNDANHDHHVDAGEIDFGSGPLSYYNVDPFTAPNPPNALAPNFKTPTTDEITAGIDHQIFNDFAVSATYTYRHAKNFQYAIPLGSTLDSWIPAGTAQGVATDPGTGFSLPFNVPFYSLNTESPVTGSLFLNRPGASTTYHGIEFSAVKRLSNKWMARVSAGWNNWTQDIPPEAILEPNNRWDLGGQNENGGTVVGFSGKSTLWINARWQFNVAALYQLPLGLNLGANFFGREGYPQSYYVRTRVADPNLGSRILNLNGHIDDFRLDNVYELDLRLDKTFLLGQVAITPSAEVFNITNNGTVLQRESRIGDFRVSNQTFTQYAFFNQILETQSPRILRLGLRVSF